LVFESPVRLEDPAPPPLRRCAAEAANEDDSDEDDSDEVDSDDEVESEDKEDGTAAATGGAPLPT